MNIQISLYKAAAHLLLNGLLAAVAVYIVYIVVRTEKKVSAARARDRSVTCRQCSWPVLPDSARCNGCGASSRLH
jgi:hypothetical protein